MRLHRVQLRNYRGVVESDVSFSQNGVTIVEGPNEVGKTAISESLQLAIDLLDSSQHRRVKAVQPVGRDEGPEVAISLTSGEYELVYRKRWLRRPQTTLEVTAPRHENWTGKEAHDRLKAIFAETLDEDLWQALRIEQGTELKLPDFGPQSIRAALDRAAGGDHASDREETLWSRIGEEYERYWTPTGQVPAAEEFAGARGKGGPGQSRRPGEATSRHRKRRCSDEQADRRINEARGGPRRSARSTNAKSPSGGTK